MVKRSCEECGKAFNAKPADIRRGWAKFCSKRCKARKQERRTGQYASLQKRTTAIHSDEAVDEQHPLSEDYGQAW